MLIGILQIIFGLSIGVCSVGSIWFNECLMNLFKGVPIHMIICGVFALLFLVILLLASNKNYRLKQLFFVVENVPHDPEDDAFNRMQFNFEFFYRAILRPVIVFIIEVLVFAGVGILICYNMGMKWFYGFFFFTLFHSAFLLIFGIYNLIVAIRGKNVMNF